MATKKKNVKKKSAKKKTPVKKKVPTKKKTAQKKTAKKSAKKKAPAKKVKKASKPKAKPKTKSKAKPKAKPKTKPKAKPKAKKTVTKKKAVKKTTTVKKTKVASKSSPKKKTTEIDETSEAVAPKKPKKNQALPKLGPETLKIKERLLAKRGELLKLIQSSKSLERDVGDLTFSNEIDLASSLEGREMVFQLTSRDRNELRLIEDALFRINEGTYGACESCEKKISLKRLQIMPLTALCIECQEAAENL